jgi:hypothetical protein
LAPGLFVLVALLAERTVYVGTNLAMITPGADVLALGADVNFELPGLGLVAALRGDVFRSACA